MANLKEGNFDLLKPKIARSLRETLSTEVRTPDGERTTPCDVYVPENMIEADDEELSAYATVIYVTYCPKERKHAVKIKFNYDEKGKFIRDTLDYV